MKRILITGAHGFLGKHVVKAFGNTHTLLTPTRHRLNLLDTQELMYYMNDYRPEIVIHLAAQCGGIGINRDKPGEFLYNNLMMTTNLIESCRWNCCVEKFVGVGTVCSYPKFTPVPFKEEDLYNGYPEETNAPYGLAKRMQLEMLRAYRTQYGLNGICLIPTNMIGEHDNFKDESSHVVPALLKKFHSAKLHNHPSVTLWGDGSATREFLYAGDCAEAIVKATELYNEPDPVNIGTGVEITIKDLAEKVRQVVGFNGNIIWDTSKPNGQPRRCLDVSRAKEAFGFEAKANFNQVLHNMYSWAQENNVL